MKIATIFGVTALAAVIGFAAEQKPVAPATTPVSTNKIAELFPDTAVAKGKGLEIKRSKLDGEVTKFKANFAMRGQSFPPGEQSKLERRQLEQLIQIELLLPRTTDADRAKGKTTADKRFADIRKKAPSEEVLDRQLKLAGMTQDDLKKGLLDESTREAVLERELDATITDEQAKKFYDENPSKFEDPEKVRVSHILFATEDPKTRSELTEEQKQAKKKLAEDILKRAKSGEDFTKLAKEFSEDPGVTQNSGEYKFSRDDPFVPEFKAASFSLKTNEISDLVITQFGYHIIKLNEKIPAHKVELAKVSEEIKQYLSALEMQKKLRPYFEKLKKEADVKILDEKLAAIDPYADEPLPAGEAPAGK